MDTFRIDDSSPKKFKLYLKFSKPSVKMTPRCEFQVPFLENPPVNGRFLNVICNLLTKQES